LGIFPESSFNIKKNFVVIPLAAEVSLASKQVRPYLTKNSHLLVAISTERKLLQKWQTK